jgi:hypothetical protein
MTEVIQDDPQAPASPEAAPTPAPAARPAETNRQMQAMRLAGTFGSIHNLLEGFRATEPEGSQLLDLAQQRLGEACHWATSHVFRFGMPELKAPAKPADGVAVADGTPAPAPTPAEAAAALGAVPTPEAQPGTATTSEPEGQVGGTASAEEAATTAGVQTAV